MSRSVHKTKESAADAFWAKMKEEGADKAVTSFVSLATLDFLPADDDPEGFVRLVGAVVEVAWKRGFCDAMEAIEGGFVKGVLPDDEKHQNN